MSEQTEIGADGKISTLRERTLEKIRAGAAKKRKSFSGIFGESDFANCTIGTEKRLAESENLLRKFTRKYRREWKTLSENERTVVINHIAKLTEEVREFKKFRGENPEENSLENSINFAKKSVEKSGAKQ